MEIRILGENTKQIHVIIAEIAFLDAPLNAPRSYITPLFLRTGGVENGLNPADGGFADWKHVEMR